MKIWNAPVLNSTRQRCGPLALVLAIAAMACLLIGSPAHAQWPEGRLPPIETTSEPPPNGTYVTELEARLRYLEERVQAQSQEHEQLRLQWPASETLTAAEGAPPPESVAPAPAAVEVGKDLSVKGAWKDGFIFESPNKDFRMQVGGRTQLDAIWMQSDATGLAGAGGVDERDSVGFRRARLTFRGSMYEVYSWVAEFDFVNSVNLNPGLQGASEVLGNVANVTAPTDLWWSVKEVPLLGTLTIGNHKEPLGMEHLTSSRFLDWMERSYLQDAYTGPFNNGFSPGISFHNYTQNERVTWALGAYKGGNNIFAFNTGDGEYAATGRMTCLPYYDEPSGGRYLFHLGVSGSYRDTDEGRLRIRSRGSLRNGPGALNPTLADTGTFFADNQGIVGAEAAALWGSLHLQGEYMASVARDAVNGAGAQVDHFSHGYYVEALYFLTGEHRAYDRRFGAFGRKGQETLENAFLVRSDSGPIFGRGAWQIGARYNYLDLRDSGIDGGILEDVTLGVNWFWNPNLRIQANYVVTRRDAPGGLEGNIQGFGMRMAHDF